MCISFVRQFCFIIALGCIAQLPVNGEAQTATQPSTIIKGGRLIDGRGGEPITPAMMRIEGEKIREAGGNLTVPSGAKIIDLGEATLLPGLSIEAMTQFVQKFSQGRAKTCLFS